MTIQEMHQLFRVVGQQMGMQTIRAILPEEIDVFLNMAINEKINEVLASNVLSDTSKVLTDNAKIGNLNFFRTLQKQENVEQDGKVDMTEIMLITSCVVRYEASGKTYNCRIIGIDELEKVLNDYCTEPSYDYPVCSVILNSAKDIIINTYTGDKTPVARYINYIKKPEIVSFENSINCDLPDYAHNEIVQLAVQKYFNSVGSTTHNVE